MVEKIKIELSPDEVTLMTADGLYQVDGDDILSALRTAKHLAHMLLRQALPIAHHKRQKKGQNQKQTGLTF